MIKLICTLITLFLISLLVINDTWKVTFIGFGYEVTLSIFLLFILLVAFTYAISLIKRPFGWIRNFKERRQNKKQNQREQLLLLTIKTILDKSDKTKQLILKQKKTVFAEKSDESLIIEAVFNPTPYLFEQLLHRPNTEMIGIRGLLSYAQESGDLNEVGRLLKRAYEKGNPEKWLVESMWQNQTLQNDWYEALTTLETLKKNNWISKEQYRLYKSDILIKLGEYQEAFHLAPENPITGILYANQKKEKALSILFKSWDKNPCWDTYQAFRKIIQNEKPVKKMKLTEKLIHSNKEHRLSIMALAQTAIDSQMWGVAKEYLIAYFNAFPTTPETAFMMAQVERKGWHHEEGALEWEKKGKEAKDISGWGCSVCSHETKTWEAVCPTCNTMGSIHYK